MGRGQLTDEVKTLSLELLGYRIDVTELRLIPYLDYLAVNQEFVDVDKLNIWEHEILSRWKRDGYFEGGEDSPLRYTNRRAFDIFRSILWISYFDMD